MGAIFNTFLSISFSLLSISIVSYALSSYDILENSRLRAPELIQKYNHPVEIHTIGTSDGYLLDVHRIPNKKGIPVLVVHGLEESSACWVMFGPENSLAFMLADHGYDVWLFNARGNRYSRRHTNLTTESTFYWNFSFHEIGVYDLPATIDYIISLTDYPKIHYVGFSQGTTSFWIMCSEVPGYCDKIIVMNALAPVAYLGNSRSPLIVAISRNIYHLEFVTTLSGFSEFRPSNQLFALSGLLACNDRAITQVLCTNSIFFIVGFNSEQLNRTTLPIIYGHAPAGVATKQILHYGQQVRSGRFEQYNYGPIRNLIIYETVTPPAYDISKVTAPVAIQYGRNDWLTVPEDVMQLAKELPNVVEIRKVPHPKFTHGDFIYAIDAKTLVYDNIIRIMLEAERKYNIQIL